MAKKWIAVGIVVLVGCGGMFLGGCESDAQTGALLGSLAGAGVGALAGGDTEGALIGAAVGGGAGYMLGNEGDKKKSTARVQDQLNTVTVNVTNSNGSIIQVALKKSGVGYVGPRGEYYANLPTEEQLRPVYGF